MEHGNNRSEKTHALLQRAEQYLQEEKAMSPENFRIMASAEIWQTLHNLQVHEIELAMQNEELRRVQAELEISRERYFDLYDMAPVGYCSLSEDGVIQEANLTVASLLGTTRSALVSHPFSNCILNEDQDVFYLFHKAPYASGSPRFCELRLLRKDGTSFWAQLDASILKNMEGDPVFRITILDISLRRELESALAIEKKEIAYLSYHDQLTGLYNRRFFEEELKRVDTVKNLPLSIAMGDVNGLKLVNDSFGHLVGDELLIKVAEAIRKGCRADDVIVRLGGDEFVVILPKTDKVTTEKIIGRIKEFSLNETVGAVGVSISFGYETKSQPDESIQEVIRDSENNMYRHKLAESSGIRSKTIDLIMGTLFEKNNREMLHSERVGKICADIATELHFSADDVKQIRIAGMMHDIGKIGIAENILNSTERLNGEERQEIERHSEIGYRILSSVNEFSRIADIVLENHEKWNGKGYPKGLKQDEISLQGRIIAIADAFDAMTSGRPYRKALSRTAAIHEIKRGSGTQFDPAIAELFVVNVCGEVW